MDVSAFTIFRGKLQFEGKIVEARHLELPGFAERELQGVIVESPRRSGDAAVERLPADRVELEVQKVPPLFARLLHDAVGFQLQGVGVLPVRFQQSIGPVLGDQRLA